jgi:sensor histidine kinase YesM
MLTFNRKYYPFANGSTSTSSSSENSIRERFSWLDQLHSWLIVPALGIILPNLTGLIKPAQFDSGSLMAHYALFIVVALIIYKGNMFFLHSIKVRFNGSSMPYRKIVGIYFMVNIVYSSVISLASLSMWSRFFNHDLPFARPVITTTLVIIIAVLFINNLYEIFYLQAVKEASEEKMELLESAKMQAELQALNSQIDPHFMYNALTSLSYLMQQKPAEVDKYNAMLADQYKYVLQHKCCQFVSLDQELRFCQQYFAIQQLRFGDAVVMQVVTGDSDLKKLRVPPLSVQTLLENALKHNSYSEEKPLLLQVLVSEKGLTISNNIQPLTYKKKTTGTGLSNLDKRVKLLAKTSLSVERSAGKFRVSLPVC